MTASRWGRRGLAIEGGQSMGIVWTILAIIGLIVVLQFIF
jgi:hypothetical protein